MGNKGDGTSGANTSEGLREKDTGKVISERGHGQQKSPKRRLRNNTMGSCESETWVREQLILMRKGEKIFLTEELSAGDLIAERTSVGRC